MRKGDCKMNEKLTIAVPTYNRATELKSLLQEILQQLAEVAPGFAAVRVSDNASTDSTREAVAGLSEDFLRRGSRLDYVRNDENVGFSRNVDRAVKGASGEWVVIMGDDDSFEEGTLSYLERVFGEHPELDALLLGNRRYDADLSTALEPLREDSSSLELFVDGSDYIRKFHAFPPALVSGYYIRRTSWIASRAEEFDYSISIHMLTLTRMMADRATVAVSNRSSVKYRADQKNSTWPGDSLYPFRFWLDALLASKMLRKECARDVFGILNKVAYRVLAYYVIRQKVLQHKFDRRQFENFYLRAKSGVNRYSLIILIMRFVPNWLAKLSFKGLVEKTEHYTVD